MGLFVRELSWVPAGVNHASTGTTSGRDPLPFRCHKLESTRSSMAWTRQVNMICHPVFSQNHHNFNDRQCLYEFFFLVESP